MGWEILNTPPRTSSVAHPHLASHLFKLTKEFVVHALVRKHVCRISRSGNPSDSYLPTSNQILHPQMPKLKVPNATCSSSL